MDRALLINLRQFCHERHELNTEQQEARFSGHDIQRIKCLQSRAAEARLIRDHIAHILEGLEDG